MMLDLAAPDSSVTATDPSCDRTEKGAPTHRAKVRYLVARKGITDDDIERLIEDDIDNVLTLFRTFIDGTHGHAGRLPITQLSAIRIRVKLAIAFLHALCTPVP